MGLTQPQLAELLGVTRFSVNRWENGERRIVKRTDIAIRALALAAVTKPAKAA
jgi:DNA-binding transcriptional regulator YiaG